MSTVYSKPFKQHYTIYIILYTLFFSQYTLYNMIYTVYSTLYFIHWTIYTVPSSLYFQLYFLCCLSNSLFYTPGSVFSTPKHSSIFLSSFTTLYAIHPIYLKYSLSYILPLHLVPPSSPILSPNFFLPPLSPLLPLPPTPSYLSPHSSIITLNPFPIIAQLSVKLEVNNSRTLCPRIALGRCPFRQRERPREIFR